MSERVDGNGVVFFSWGVEGGGGGSTEVCREILYFIRNSGLVH